MVGLGLHVITDSMALANDKETPIIGCRLVIGKNPETNQSERGVSVYELNYVYDQNHNATLAERGFEKIRWFGNNIKARNEAGQRCIEVSQRLSCIAGASHTSYARGGISSTSYDINLINPYGDNESFSDFRMPGMEDAYERCRKKAVKIAYDLLQAKN